MNDVKAEKERIMLKKKKEKEFYEHLKNDIANKKRQEQEIMNKEKEHELKCSQDREKLHDKLDHARYLELSNKGLSGNDNYIKLKKNNIINEVKHANVESNRPSNVDRIELIDDKYENSESNRSTNVNRKEMLENNEERVRLLKIDNL